MNFNMIFTSLVNNISLLFVMTILYGIVLWRWPFGTKTNRVLSGLVFGCVAVAGMMIPLHLVPGVVFDGRSIIVALAGMTGGLITALIAACIAGAYRFWMGSTGALTGILVVFASAAVGVAYHRLLSRKPAASHPLCLYAFGVAVHTVMILLMLTLPYPVSIEVIRKIGVPVMTIYPIGTFLIAFFLLQLKAKYQSDEKIRQSEDKYRNIFENAVEGFYQTTPQGRFLSVNPALASMMGFASPDEMVAAYDDIAKQHYVEPGDRGLFRELLERQGTVQAFETQLYRKDRSVIWTSRTGRIVRDGEGKVLYYEGTVENITSRKQAEEQIKTSLREKEVLLKEVQHRVKNNLLTISGIFALQLNQMKDEKSRSAFVTSMNRINAMTKIHTRFYQSEDYSLIDFKKYIEELLLELSRSYNFPSENMKTDIKDIFIDINTAIPAGLIVNELVSNAMKHAFPDGMEGTVMVSLQRNGGDICLTVKDNGTGLPEDVDLAAAGSVGMQLIVSLAEQLGGTIALNRDNGTEFKITFGIE